MIQAPPSPFREEIFNFAKLLLGREESCIELRTLPPKEIGFFNDPSAFAEAAASLNGKANVYATLNPVSKSLLPRAENRLVRAERDLSAKDTDILCKSWFLIDIDHHKRPKNENASDEELIEVREVYRQISEHFKSRNITTVEGKSGNGFHLLIHIDYPITSDINEKHKLLLRYFNRIFGNENVGIDLSVSNPSRISRCFGTLNLKGPNTEERPQRMARLKMPVTQPQPVDLFKIFENEISEQKAFETPPPRSDFYQRSENEFSKFKGNLATLDIVSVFQSAGLFRKSLGGTKHSVTCPWSAFHTTGNINDSSTIIFEGDGNHWPTFYCSHSHCQGRGIKDVLDYFGPEVINRHCREEFKSSNQKTNFKTHEGFSGGSKKTNNGEEIALSCRKASEIESKPINWLWKGRIAKGKVSMLAGNPGLGKSQLTASLAAIVSIGGYWPVDRTKCDLGNVVIFSAEDDAADTIRPRLEAAGADLNRIVIIDPAPVLDLNHNGQKRRAFNLVDDLPRLESLLAELGNVALVVIDPVTAYLGKTDGHRNEEIRALLSPLADLAAKHETAVVCVSHFNKTTGNESLMRVMGSLAFVAAARAAFAVLSDPEDKNRRLFLPIKNNIGNSQTGLAFTVQGMEFKNSQGLIETSKIVWGSEVITTTANEVLAANSGESDRSATEEAIEWLNNLLVNGPMKAPDVQKEARQAGIGDKPLRTARERMGIKPYKKEFAGGWWWELKHSEDAQDVPLQNQGILGGKGHLRDQEAFSEAVNLSESQPTIEANRPFEPVNLDNIVGPTKAEKRRARNQAEKNLAEGSVVNEF